MKRIACAALVGVILAGCGGTRPTVTASQATSASATATTTTQASAGAQAYEFPTELFAALDGQPVSDEVATRLQEVLDSSADGDGLTAAVISPEGTWIGATGMATADRAMVPEDQMGIGSVTKTLVAAQIMLMVEAGTLALEDLADDRLPPGLDFDTNGATIDHLRAIAAASPSTSPTRTSSAPPP